MFCYRRSSSILVIFWELHWLEERRTHLSESPTTVIERGVESDMVIAEARKWNVPRLSHLSGDCLVKNVVISLWMCGDAPSCCIRMRIVNANVDQTLLQHFWHEVDYHLDVSRVTNGAQIIWNMIFEKFRLGFYIAVLLIFHAYSFSSKNSRNLPHHLRSLCII